MTLISVCSAADVFGYARKNWAKEPLVLLTVASGGWSLLLEMSLWAGPIVRTVASALPFALLALWCLSDIVIILSGQGLKGKAFCIRLTMLICIF